MKFLSKSLLSVTCASVLASGVMFSSAANAELTAMAGVASEYYWRGLKVSNGAQVWGELTLASESGFYGDLWASSEGFGVGPEYDLSAGWAGKFGDFGVNVGAVTYVYSMDSTGTFCAADTQDSNGDCTGKTYVLEDSDPGDFTDVYVKMSFGPAFLNIYHNVALLQGQDFVNAGFTADKFTFAVGYQQFKDKAQLALGYDSDVSKVDYTYAEVTYAATKNLSFTVSSIIDHSGDLNFFGIAPVADTNRAKVIVSYSLPIEM
ncbi:MAG: hypothetical protein QM709_05175 [Spongiibacteraceae bacterium]